MIDKILVTNNIATIIYSHRTPVRVVSDNNDIPALLRWLFTSSVLTYGEFKRALEIENEETCEIDISGYNE